MDWLLFYFAQNLAKFRYRSLYGRNNLPRDGFWNVVKQTAEKIVPRSLPAATRVASLPLTLNCDETRQRRGDELHLRRGEAVKVKI